MDKYHNGFIAHFVSPLAIGEKLMHEHNHKQLYYISFDFCSSQKQILTFHYASWALYQSGAYLVMNDNFLAAFLHISLVLSQSGTSLCISYFFIIAPIFIFKDL